MTKIFQFDQTKARATFLIREGMRVALVQSMTGIPRSNLLTIRKAIHGADAATGRMPTDVVSYIKNGQSAAGLASVVVNYLANEKNKSPVEAFVTAWLAAKLIGIPMDINAAWLAVRDVKAGLIGWNRCKCCAAWHFVGLGSKKLDNCPFCSAQQQKHFEALQ